MTEIQLKKLFQNMIAIKIYSDITTELKDYTDRILSIDDNRNMSLYNLLLKTMGILNEEEKFIIETHLVNHKTWAETVLLYSKWIGTDMARSERTLKRIQKNAIERMCLFFNYVVDSI